LSGPGRVASLSGPLGWSPASRAGWAMKVRTCLLFACMIIVPGLAMFSHHVPGEVWCSARSVLWDQWGEAFVAEPAVGPPQASGSVAADPETGRGVGEELRADAAAARGQLAALGAVAIEARPLEGVSGVHVASCRVAMDADGQLHRVFQAAAASSDEAVSQLLRQVVAWRERLAARAASSPPR
jgi:hypothetical protein